MYDLANYANENELPDARAVLNVYRETNAFKTAPNEASNAHDIVASVNPSSINPLGHEYRENRTLGKIGDTFGMSRTSPLGHGYQIDKTLDEVGAALKASKRTQEAKERAKKLDIARKTKEKERSTKQ